MKRITILAVVASLCGLWLAAPSAQAAYLVELMQQGNNVVATGSGALDITALTKGLNQSGDGTSIDASIAQFQTGPFIVGVGLDELSPISGPANFGSGGLHGGTGTGDALGIFPASNPPVLLMPSGYQSGTPLSSHGTFSNASIASLGVTPGTYVYTWGTGAHADSFTLKIDAPVPEPASLTLLAIGMVGFLGYRQRRRRQRGETVDSTRANAIAAKRPQFR
jgi:PEP-CTERM motif-containing protein